MTIARVTAFNNLLREIFTIVSLKSPDDKDLEYTKNQIDLVFSVSPRKTITMFIKSTKPYLEKILHKDEVFFLDMANETEALEGLSLNTKWSTLSDVEKEKIWKNVQKMVVLGNKILVDD